MKHLHKWKIFRFGGLKLKHFEWHFLKCEFIRGGASWYWKIVNFIRIKGDIPSWTLMDQESFKSLKVIKISIGNIQITFVHLPSSTFLSSLPTMHHTQNKRKIPPIIKIFPIFPILSQPFKKIIKNLKNRHKNSWNLQRISRTLNFDYFFVYTVHAKCNSKINFFQCAEQLELQSTEFFFVFKTFTKIETNDSRKSAKYSR